MNRFISKCTAGLLSAGLVLSFVPQVMGTEKVDASLIKNEDNTLLGTSRLASPKNGSRGDDWSGSYIYFGNYEGDPIKFRVLDSDTTKYGSRTVFLDSDECLFKSNLDDNSNDWDSSLLRYYLNNAFVDEAFTGREYRALARSTLAGGENYSNGSFHDRFYCCKEGLSGDYVFILSLDEIMDVDYGYDYNYGYNLNPSSTWTDPDPSFTTIAIPNHTKKLGDEAQDWRLRTRAKIDTHTSGCVLADGRMGLADVRANNTAVAPALNIKQDSILFSTLVNGKLRKEDAEYKLTLIDEDIKITEAYGEQPVCDGRKVTVPYVLSGSAAGNVTRVSVLILDKNYMYGNQNNANIIYYGELEGDYEVTTAYDYADIVNYGTFNLPGGLNVNKWGKEYYVSIIAEVENGTYETDYSSLPAQLSAPEVITQAGWVKTEDGKWYYYFEDGSYPEWWLELDGDWYLFLSGGEMATGWARTCGSWYYFGTSGRMKTGWKFIDNNWYFFCSTGQMLNYWQQLGDKWYYLGSDGVMRTGWQTINGKTYYLASDGHMAADEYINGYWLNADGSWTYQYRATWKKDSTGWWYGDTSGWYAKNATYRIDGKDYNFNSEGYCTNP